MKDMLTIGEVAKRSGIRASAIRFYEEKGLIASAGRHGLHRLFRLSVLNRLSLIALARYAGFSLNEIVLMFPANGKVIIDRKKLLMRADEIEVTIKKLSALKNGLKHVAHCPEKDQLECPKFQRLVSMAGKVQLKSGRATKRGSFSHV